MDSSALTFLAVLAVVGLLVALLGWSVQQRWDQLLATGGRASGQVVRLSRHSGRNSVVYSVVRFTTATGAVIEAEYTAGLATSFPSHYVGQRVRVAYDKRNPTDFLLLG